MKTYTASRQKRQKNTVKQSSKQPKTFALYVHTNDGHRGFFRYRSILNAEGQIDYVYVLVDNYEDASKYLNFELLRDRVQMYKQKFDFESINIISVQNLSTYQLKKKSAKPFLVNSITP